MASGLPPLIVDGDDPDFQEYVVSTIAESASLQKKQPAPPISKKKQTAPPKSKKGGKRRKKTRKYRKYKKRHYSIKRKRKSFKRKRK